MKEYKEKYPRSCKNINRAVMNDTIPVVITNAGRKVSSYANTAANKAFFQNHGIKSIKGRSRVIQCARLVANASGKRKACSDKPFAKVAFFISNKKKKLNKEALGRVSSMVRNIWRSKK
jgi:hypothetical protein